MGLFDDLKDPPIKVGACKVRDTAASLDPKDGAALLALVDDVRWKIQPLENALAKKGFVISGSVLKRHRNRTCACGAMNV